MPVGYFPGPYSVHVLLLPIGSGHPFVWGATPVVIVPLKLGGSGAETPDNGSAIGALGEFHCGVAWVAVHEGAPTGLLPAQLVMNPPGVDSLPQTPIEDPQ